MVTVNLVHLSRISCLLMIGFSVHQSKSDSIGNGIIMNGANEKTEDSANMAPVDGSIDKSAGQRQSLANKAVVDNHDNDDVTRRFPINGSIQQQQIDPVENVPFDKYLAQYLANHTGAEVVRPKNQTDNTDYKFRYSYPKAQNIVVVVHLLDINPYTNWLFINLTSALGSRSQFNLTECIKPPHVKIIQFQSTQEIFIHFQFANSEWTHYHGFVLTIQQLADNNSNNVKNLEALQTTVSPNFISNSTETLKVLIEVPKLNQHNETWKFFRHLFAKSTNQFINATGINVEKCSENNVTLINNTCRSDWSNAQNCAELDFSIRLNLRHSNATNHTNVSDANNTIDVIELKYNDLIRLWIEFGRNEFASNGFKEFPEPDAKRLLFIWATICLAVVGAFFLILLAIIKMDILRDYRRMYWRNGEDKEQICKPTDMAMYPTVHQIVPTLFPNDLSTSNNLSNALPFECVSRPITFSAGDFKRRRSLEESLKPSGNTKRTAGEVPFQSESDFNEAKHDRPEDEMCI